MFTVYFIRSESTGKFYNGHKADLNATVSIAVLESSQQDAQEAVIEWVVGLLMR